MKVKTVYAVLGENENYGQNRGMIGRYRCAQHNLDKRRGLQARGGREEWEWETKVLGIRRKWKLDP